MSPIKSHSKPGRKVTGRKTIVEDFFRDIKRSRFPPESLNLHTVQNFFPTENMTFIPLSLKKQAKPNQTKPNLIGFLTSY